jgi:hypothetical protein
MEIIFELIFSFLIEIIGEGLFQLLVELGVRSLGSNLGISKPEKPILSLLGYILLATAGAFISIAIFKNHFIKNETLRIVNLIIAPIILGLMMKFRGKKLEHKNINTIRLDSFWYGYVFALTFALIRLLFSE